MYNQYLPPPPPYHYSSSYNIMNGSSPPPLPLSPPPPLDHSIRIRLKSPLSFTQSLSNSISSEEDNGIPSRSIINSSQSDRMISHSSSSLSSSYMDDIEGRNQSKSYPPSLPRPSPLLSSPLPLSSSPLPLPSSSPPLPLSTLPPLSPSSSIHPHLPSYDQVTRITMRRPNDMNGLNGRRQASFRAAIHNSYQLPSNQVVDPSTSSSSSSTPLSPSLSLITPISSINSQSDGSSSSSLLINQSPSSMRRPRPKSYVLATSSSFPVSSNDTINTSSIIHRSDPLRGELNVLKEDKEKDKRRRKTVQSDTSINTNISIPPSDNEGDTRGTTQRLHRIIALFSHSNDDHKTSTSRDVLSDKKDRRRRSRTTVVTNRYPLPSNNKGPLSIRSSDTVKQGALLHQELSLGVSLDTKKLNRISQWNQCWAVLNNNKLYLCRQLSSYQSHSNGEKMLSIPSDAECLNLEGALADIAYEYTRVKEEHRYIVRVVTQERSEHLLQCTREIEMLEWINRIQEASATCSSPSPSTYNTSQEDRSNHIEGESNRLSNTTQLIMHRYKAKSTAIGSPLSSKRSSTDIGTSSSSNPSSSRGGGSMNIECNGESTSSGGTPKTGRRWKRGKDKDKDKTMKQWNQSGGDDRPGPSNTTLPSFALGTKLIQCPSGGNGDLVPLVVRSCIDVVEKNGMDTIGIYRIPGNTAAVNALKESLGNGGIESVDISDPRWKDVNVVSSLLKMFLRKLPEPLLTDKLYPFFIDANRMSNHHQRLHKIRNLLRKLPRAHYETLKYLIAHLLLVASHAEINRMEARNLALMFGPSIVRPSDDSMATMVTHMSDQCRIVESFLHYYNWMFDDNGTCDDKVPDKSPFDKEPIDQKSGVDGPPPGVSCASFNDMHSLIIRANEKQAEDMMKENDRGKIKNILNVRRSSKRDKSKGKMKIEQVESRASTSNIHSYPSSSSNPSHEPSTSTYHINRYPLQSTRTESSVESAFSGNYQERDIDAEIASRSKCSSGESNPPSRIDRKDDDDDIDDECHLINHSVSTSQRNIEEESRKKQQENISSARRIFIAGSEAAVRDSLSSHSHTSATIDSFTSHTQHLHQASSPALEIYSAETREKIRRMQLLGTSAWRQFDKISSPSREDALSCTSDYSTTSSIPPSQSIGVVVTSNDALGTTSSDYASSDPSPCARTTNTNDRRGGGGGDKDSEMEGEELNRLSRPSNLGVIPLREVKGRRKGGNRIDRRRHTVGYVHESDEKESRSSLTLSNIRRWVKGGLIRGKSYPTMIDGIGIEDSCISIISSPSSPPIIIRTSPNEMTPISGDEQL